MLVLADGGLLEEEGDEVDESRVGVVLYDGGTKLDQHPRLAGTRLKWMDGCFAWNVDSSHGPDRRHSRVQLLISGGMLKLQVTSLRVCIDVGSQNHSGQLENADLWKGAGAFLHVVYKPLPAQLLVPALRELDAP